MMEDFHQTAGEYDVYAEQYSAIVETREAGGVNSDPFGILPAMLALLGKLAGLRALDAGCGEGYLARVLATEGARVTGIDISPRLIWKAREKDPEGAIDFRVADLTKPLLEEEGAFDVVASYLVLNDVRDYRSFITTLSRALKRGGRMAVALNNPYGAVVHHHITDYFATGARSPYRGLWALGVKTYHHHRTLENYLDAFLEAGLHLTKLRDLDAQSEIRGRQTGLSEDGRFPRFMVLGFVRP